MQMKAAQWAAFPVAIVTSLIVQYKVVLSYELGFCSAACYAIYRP